MLAHLLLLDKCLLNCIYCTNIMFRQYHAPYCIYFICSNFKTNVLISFYFSVFIQNRTFLNALFKERSENSPLAVLLRYSKWNLCIIHLEQLHESSVSLKTITQHFRIIKIFINSLHNNYQKVIMKYQMTMFNNRLSILLL